MKALFLMCGCYLKILFFFPKSQITVAEHGKHEVS